jgi:hypothetical protein
MLDGVDPNAAAGRSRSFHDGLLPGGTLTLVAGAPGAGKSTVALLMAVAPVIGATLFGKSHEPMPPVELNGRLVPPRILIYESEGRLQNVNATVAAFLPHGEPSINPAEQVWCRDAWGGRQVFAPLEDCCCRARKKGPPPRPLTVCPQIKFRACGATQGRDWCLDTGLLPKIEADLADQSVVVVVVDSLMAALSTPMLSNDMDAMHRVMRVRQWIQLSRN